MIEELGFVKLLIHSLAWVINYFPSPKGSVLSSDENYIRTLFQANFREMITELCLAASKCLPSIDLNLFISRIKGLPTLLMTVTTGHHSVQPWPGMIPELHVWSASQELMASRLILHLFSR